MDPDATYALMTDESNDLDERAVAATDLLVWLAKGGAAPSAWRTPGGFYRADERAADIDICRTRVFQALDRLAELEGT